MNNFIKIAGNFLFINGEKRRIFFYNNFLFTIKPGVAYILLSDQINNDK